MALERFAMGCSTCPCFVLIPGQAPLPGQPNMGKCHRHPPTLLIVPSQIQGGVASLQSDFPITPANGHCWEYPAMRGLEMQMNKMIEMQLQQSAEATKN